MSFRHCLNNHITHRRFHAVPKIVRSAFTALFLASLWLAISCSDGSQSSTDLVTITSINACISDRDVSNGIVRSRATTERVTMPHSVHEKADVSCKDCHHKAHNDERIKKCASCHKGVAGAKLFHTFCMGCHAKRRSGPTACDRCHLEKKSAERHDDIKRMFKQTFAFSKEHHTTHEYADIKCVICHHDAGAGSKQKMKRCDDCHAGRSKMVILHYFCKDCHRRQSGPVGCEDCHKGVKAAYTSMKAIILLDKTGHRLPQIMFNHKAHIEQYNTECIDCHHLGSTKKCSSCHMHRDRGEVINIKGAYHQQCQDCHRRNDGPKGCHRCHREKDGGKE